MLVGLLATGSYAIAQTSNEDRRLRRAQDDLSRADSHLSRSKDERDRADAYLRRLEESRSALKKELAETRARLDDTQRELQGLEGRLFLSRQRVSLLTGQLFDARASCHGVRRRCDDVERRCRNCKEEEADRCRRERDEARDALRRAEEQVSYLGALLAKEQFELFQCEQSYAELKDLRIGLAGQVGDLARTLDAREREREQVKQDLSDLEDQIRDDEDDQASSMLRAGDVRQEVDKAGVLERARAEVSEIKLVDASGDGRFTPGEEMWVRLYLTRDFGHRLTSVVEVSRGDAVVLDGQESLEIPSRGPIETGRLRILASARPGSGVAVHVSLVDGTATVFTQILFAPVSIR